MLKNTSRWRTKFLFVTISAFFISLQNGVSSLSSSLESESYLIDLGFNDFVSSQQLHGKPFFGLHQDAAADSQKSRPMRPAKPCGSTFVNGSDGENGIIESPNYPNSYEPGSDCTWKIEAQEGHEIHLTVFDVRLLRNLDHLDESDFEVDALYMSPTGDWEELQRYAGNLNSLTPFSMHSESNKFYIRFKSSRRSHANKNTDDIFGPSGFRIMFYITKQSDRPGGSKPGNSNQAVASACQVGQGKPSGGNSAVSAANTRPTSRPNKPGSQQVQQQQGGQGQLSQFRPPSQFKPKNKNKGLSPKLIQQLGTEWEEISKLNRSTGDPFLVALVLDKEYFCSGTLIRNDFVVTSAHCTDEVKQIHMLFGANDIRVNDAAVQIRSADSSNVIQHPNYDPFTGANDISLIRLNEPIRNSPYVKPAILPKWGVLGEAFSGVHSRVSGWGTGTNGIETKSSSTNSTIVPNRLCRASIHKNINGMLMCSRGDLNQNSCQMDLGSPVTTRCADSGGVGTTNVECQSFCIVNAGCLRDLYFGNETYVEDQRQDNVNKPLFPSLPGINQANNNNNNNNKPTNKPPRPNKPITNRPQSPGNNNNNQRPPGSIDYDNGNNNNPSNQIPIKPPGQNNPFNPSDNPLTNNPFNPANPGNQIYAPGGGCSGGQGRSGNVLLGFLSFGSCRKGLVYTRINAHLDFLEKHMGSLYEKENSY